MLHLIRTISGRPDQGSIDEIYAIFLSATGVDAIHETEDKAVFVNFSETLRNQEERRETRAMCCRRYPTAQTLNALSFYFRYGYWKCVSSEPYLPCAEYPLG